MDSLGCKLKDLRKSCNLTMEQLADKMNTKYNTKINKGMLSKWENNLGEPSLENMRILSDFYQVSLDFLLNIEFQKEDLELSSDDVTIKLDKHRAVNEEFFEQCLYYRIKLRREELGMSQEELAIKLGYKSRSTIAKIESGANDIPQSKIKAFADALNTTTSYLMGWDDNENLLEQTITNKEKKLLSYYNQLNNLGKDKLIENAEDLTHNIKYSDVVELSVTIEEEKDYLIPRAAHSDNEDDLDLIRQDLDEL